MATLDSSDKYLEFEAWLRLCISHLQTDFISGARKMADESLSTLRSAVEIAAQESNSQEEMWGMLVQTAKGLVGARPSMSAATKYTLLRALSEIRKKWDERSPCSISEFAQVAREEISAQLALRSEASKILSRNFVDWVSREYTTSTANSDEGDVGELAHLRILTLSNSSTIRAALLALLENDSRGVKLALTILESRPRFEGADLAAQLLSSFQSPSNESSVGKREQRSQLVITIAPDCAVGSVMKNQDIVLLGADRISANGDVSNKIGSLSAAVCAKYVGDGKAKVAVLSEVDKIVAATAVSTERSEEKEEVEEPEVHGFEELSAAWGRETRRVLCGENGEKGDRVDGFGEWFEWVPRELLDMYITNRGVLGGEEVAGLGQEIGEVEALIFGKA